MKILITGICGFVGSTLARAFKESLESCEILGVDNLIRPGSEQNRLALKRAGIPVRHADLRAASDFEGLPAADWVVDAAANPSVLAGADGRTSSRQLLEHNLFGTVNMLEYCRRHGCGFVLLSTSRVYSIDALSRIPVEVVGNALSLTGDADGTHGLSAAGVAEGFSTAPPLSLYGAGKLASETLALEYGEAFGFPVWINRCGVLAGAGQFGFAEQGIFSFWVHSWAQRQPLKYIGFGGQGHQVRDCLHPRDLLPVLKKQMNAGSAAHRVCNFSGGIANAMSLAQLSAWCADRFGAHEVDSVPEVRRYDIPWLVLDSGRAKETWDWEARTAVEDALEEIAAFAEEHPEWLELSAPA
jgi:CDP-paratose 2-epimerase